MEDDAFKLKFQNRNVDSVTNPKRHSLSYINTTILLKPLTPTNTYKERKHIHNIYKYIMARLAWCLMVLAIWVVTTMSFLGQTTVVYGLPGSCEGDMEGLITECAVYVRKGTPMADPSAKCCEAVKTVDIPCVCQNISKEIESLVDMDKVFHLASSCGRPLPHGTKCGSKFNFCL